MNEFDKYYYYQASVQSPEAELDFISKTFNSLRGYEAESFREDFCGTFALCCEWVKSNNNRRAYGIDLDPEPLAYGKKEYFTKLSEDQKNRLSILEDNVMSNKLPLSQIACALNFSYFIFKKRTELKNYFQNAYSTLADDGILVLDCFGGSQCYEANEEETEHEDQDFSYFWDQDSFNPVNNHAQFYIHIKRKGEAKREKVFRYDWRMWSIAEIRDLLEEVGFKSTHVYWEGTDEDGEGDGEYTRTEEGEECEAWVSYIVALK